MEEAVASLDLRKRAVRRGVRDELVLYRKLKGEMEALLGLYPESPAVVGIRKQNQRERETEVSVGW